MIVYDYCSNLPMDKVYQAFMTGFSDYIIKVDISQEEFVKRFFGAEGNQLENSFIALDDCEPIGLILGGIKDYEGILTIRCGTLCVHPDYRGKGVSKDLFQLHKKAAVDNNCKQMFLEVIVGNERAIRFYENLGYEKVYDIKYYSIKNLEEVKSKDFLNIVEIDFKDFIRVKKHTKDIHINWQNDYDYMEKLGDSLVYYGVYKDSDLIAAMGISKTGKISFLWVDPDHRQKQIGRNLIKNAANKLKLNNVNINFSNNAKLEGFINSMGFQKDYISQYEMYLTI